MVSDKPDTVSQLRRLALATMAERGIDGMTVQQIADEAGCAKSNVLYHFGSKQGLVEAALAPSVAALGELVGYLEGVVADGGSIADPEPAARFVDTLVEHRHAANLVLNRMGELPEGELLDRLCEGIQRLTGLVADRTSSLEDGLRIAIVLGGVAFALAGPMCAPADAPYEELRPALIKVAQELLEPSRGAAPALADAAAPAA